MRHEFNCHISSQSSDPDSELTDRIIQTEPMLRFRLDYPLNMPISFEAPHDDGSPWTERQFVDAIYRAYQAAYDSVGSDTHELEDLYLEGAERNSDGSWSLNIGS